MRRGGPAAPFVGAPGASSDIPDLTEHLPPGKLGELPAEGAVSALCTPSVHCVSAESLPETLRPEHKGAQGLQRLAVRYVARAAW